MGVVRVVNSVLLASFSGIAVALKVPKSAIGRMLASQKVATKAPP